MRIVVALSIVMLSVFMLSVVLLSVTMLCVTFLLLYLVKCRYAECCGIEPNLFVLRCPR
jgi:hypothetical protein